MKDIAATSHKGGTGRATPAGHPAAQATPAGRGEAPWKPPRPVRARVLLDRVDPATNDDAARHQIPAQVAAPQGPPRPSPRPAPGQAAAAPGAAAAEPPSFGLAAPGAAAAEPPSFGLAAPGAAAAPAQPGPRPSGLPHTVLILLAVLTASCVAIFFLAMGTN